MLETAAQQVIHEELVAELAAQVGLARPEIVSRLTAGWILQSMARHDEARARLEAWIHPWVRGRILALIEEARAAGRPRRASPTRSAWSTCSRRCGSSQGLLRWVDRLLSV